MQFDHEKLDVYQVSIQFIGWRIAELKFQNHIRNVYDQLERASISIPLNIAEGNGKSFPKDRKRYFEIARGSAFESAACLDILFSMHILNTEQLQCGKALLHRIVSMLTRMISLLANSVHDDSEEYQIDTVT